MKNFIYLYLFLLSLNFNAQVKDSLPNISDEYYLIKEGDSLTIALDEIALLPKQKFKSRLDKRYYYWFRKKVFKAYPFAVLAAKKVDTLNAELEKIKSKSKKRKHVRKVQAEVDNELKDKLKNMTRTEGRIFLKLIHRQTGNTAFENIKEMRSGWKAFWYNSTAKVFKISLKDEYQPNVENEDYLIEDIIQRAYINETLEFQESKLNLNFIEILERRKGDVDVEVYKKQFAKRRKKKENKK